MDALLHSFALVALSEMGDKTQLLALMLAIRFQKPWIILAGILVATLFNHALASALGGWVAGMLAPGTLKMLLALSFFAFGIWMLVPDKAEDSPNTSSFGAFLTTVFTFFLAEMGDKTQLATLAMGARFQSLVWVTAGTTLGMLVADGMAVFLGERLTEVIPMKYMRAASALTFGASGAWMLWDTGGLV